MPQILKRSAILLSSALLALSLSACAKSISTSGLNGEAKQAAETIKDLQSDATAGDEKKVCQNDLASAAVARLNTAKGGCQHAIKDQLGEIDSFEVTIDSVALGGTAAARTATAHVKSVVSGKKRASTISLVKEGGKWKVAAIG